MRAPARAALLATLFAVGCADADRIEVPDHEGSLKSTSAVRADRRAYDGAPPTVPHPPFGADCENCHNERGRSVSGVGFAPASPHVDTDFEDQTVRCRQCHVFHTTDDLFVDSEFEGLVQDLAAGDRATPGAPPRIPHRVLMRENCVACHDGPGAREAIRTDHPERARCRQCHVPVESTTEFETQLDPVGSDLD